MPEVIRKKREGLELTTEEIEFFINGVVKKTISHGQIGAMLMAIFLKDFSLRETADFTKSMIQSGEILNFKNFTKDVLVDKHSTGGVGDKVSLILAPALAACGLKVPMVSGRGLAFTGGTLDKLESIPGFQVNITPERMNKCLSDAGLFICGASNNLAPADAELYQMRDITSTVESSTLVVSSILSKKATTGAGILIMDVKFGRGAVWKTEEEARRTANILINVGEMLNLNIKLIISEMNVPLGRNVGNSLEVLESIKFLRNEERNQLSELVELLGAAVLEHKGMVKNLEEGKIMIRSTLENNSALKCFEKMLIGQGVSEENAQKLCAAKFSEVLPIAAYETLLESPKKGVITDIDALKIGQACWHLGGGRHYMNSKIDYSVGITLLKLVGDKVEEGEPWIRVYHSTPELKEKVEYYITESLIVETKPKNIRSTIKTFVVK